MLNRQVLFIGERTVFTNKNPDHLVPAGAAGRRQIFALERNRALIDKVGRAFSANPKKRSDLCRYRAVVGERYFNFAALVVGKRARPTNTQALEGICSKRLHAREIHRNQINAYFAIVVKDACTDKLDACGLDALDISLNRTGRCVRKRPVVDSQRYSFTVFLCCCGRDQVRAGRKDETSRVCEINSETAVIRSLKQHAVDIAVAAGRMRTDVQ